MGNFESSGAGNSPQGAAASRKNLIRNMTRPGGQGLERGSGRSHCSGSGHSPVTNISLKEPQDANDRQLHSISRTFGSKESRTSVSCVRTSYRVTAVVAAVSSLDRSHGEKHPEHWAPTRHCEHSDLWSIFIHRPPSSDWLPADT